MTCLLATNDPQGERYAPLLLPESMMVRGFFQL